MSGGFSWIGARGVGDRRAVGRDAGNWICVQSINFPWLGKGVLYDIVVDVDRVD